MTLKASEQRSEWMWLRMSLSGSTVGLGRQQASVIAHGLLGVVAVGEREGWVKEIISRV